GPLMPAKAGIQFLAKVLGPRFRGDERRVLHGWSLTLSPRKRGPRGDKLLDAGPKLQFAISSYKSRQLGFVSSINSIFQARFHFLICRSRVKADSLESCASYQIR